MPNYVTTEIIASKKVLDSMINKENYVDFSNIIPFPEDMDYDFNSVPSASESYASIFFKVEHEENEWRRDFRIREEEKIKKELDPYLLKYIKKVQDFTEEEFEVFFTYLSENPIASLVNGEIEFLHMLKNKYKTNYLHTMDFQRDCWGTKWNAMSIETKEDSIKFQTAWSTPTPVLLALSERFPEEIIKIKYADEDLGFNCGSFTIKNGVIVEQDIGNNKHDDESRKKWNKFAFDFLYPDGDPKEYGFTKEYLYKDDEEEVEDSFEYRENTESKNNESEEDDEPFDIDEYLDEDKN
ncbi:MAG: hypothetical protein CL760_01770 [Chloroflexi bacterium]|nr:hypothetical protein [Chloroflexota bacterium]|tara:strand:+ start:28488 stop:29375 length:888 start_codon:yes stop_codon:yes gene_type:complete